MAKGTGQAPKTKQAEEGTQYLYRVDLRLEGDYLRVQVGTYDPNRWPEADGHPGGLAFGETAELLVEQRQVDDKGEPVTEISVDQGNIGFHSLEVAARRADVFRQAVDMGEFVKDSLESGDPLAMVGQFLKGNLKEEPGEPAKKGFRYAKEGLAARDAMEAIERAAGSLVS